MKELLKRINELAHIAKERELTEEEFKERAKLRDQYIKEFRSGFEEVLLNTTVKDAEGTDVTPEKLRKAQAEKKVKQEESSGQAEGKVCHGNAHEVEALVRKAQEKQRQKKDDQAEAEDA